MKKGNNRAKEDIVREDFIKEMQILMAECFGNRKVIDPQNRSILLPNDCISRLKGSIKVSEQEIIILLQYINCVDDTITKPTETWLAPDEKTVRYLKTYTTISCVVEAVDDVLVNYEIVFPEKYSYIESLRCGHLLLS